MKQTVPQHHKYNLPTSRVLALVIVALALTVSSSAFAAGPQYLSENIPFKWYDGANGVEIDLRNDDFEAIPIGFSFAFYKTVFNNAKVSSNGYVMFGEGGDARDPRAHALPSGVTPNAIIAGLWDDLDPSAGGRVYYDIQGDTPHRRLVIQYDGVPFRGTSVNNTFQIVLFEGSGYIMINLLDTGRRAPGARHSIGIEDHEGGEALQIDHSDTSFFQTSFILRGPIHPFGVTPDCGDDGTYKCYDIPFEYDSLDDEVGQGRPDGYEVERLAPFNWVDVPTGLQKPVVLGDDTMQTVSLEMNFAFFGQNHTSAIVSSNGLLGFGPNNGLTSRSPTWMPDPAEPNNFIAMLWTDLDPSAGGRVWSATIGTAPNRRFVLTFEDVPYRGSDEHTNTFQAVLREEDGGIDLNYEIAARFRTYGIGLEDRTGRFGNTAMLDALGLTQRSVVIRYQPGAPAQGDGQVLWQGPEPYSLYGCDDARRNVDLPFEIDFYNESFDSLWISTNGMLGFEKSDACDNSLCGLRDYTPDPIPSVTLPQKFYAPGWADHLPCSGGAIMVRVRGSSPRRQVVVEWKDVPNYWNLSRISTVQVILDERSGDIDFHLQQLHVPEGREHTVGVERGDGAGGVQISHSTGDVRRRSWKLTRRDFETCAPEDLGQTCGFEGGQGDCAQGITTCVEATVVCSQRNFGTDEVCDGRDNDCDGDTDTGIGSIFYFDRDGDGYGDPDIAQRMCQAQPRYVSNPNDCNDRDNDVHPGATEICDGLDNDCDNEIDELGDVPAPFREGSLVGYWHFDEQTGSSVHDLAGQRTNIGTIHGDAHLDEGYFGQGLALDGRGDFMRANSGDPQLNLGGLRGVTVTAWVKATSLTSTAFVFNNRSVAIRLRNGRPAMRLQGISDTSWLTYSQALPLNEWHHLAATYDGRYMRLWLDGRLIRERTVSGVLRSSSNVIVGHTNINANRALIGVVDEVMIYRSALSPSGIRAIMHPDMPGGGVQCRIGGNGVGICGQGETVCTGRRFRCDAREPLGEEICNGQDDNCDGRIDEGNPGGGGTCSTGLQGVCAQGALACTGGSLSCNANTLPGTLTEVCDGRDNDCDGSTDESFPTQGDTCSTGRLGVCGIGAKACTSGREVCEGPNPSSEVCDNQDNDCDGDTDENITRACTNNCGGGTESCQAGNFVGCTARQPTLEICDGEDNDCDGSTDESLRRSCSTVCGGGTEVCGGGVWGNCSARTPSAEVCDGRDNDCDGFTDNSESCGCQFFPEGGGDFTAEEEWAWSGSLVAPDHAQVGMAPMVSCLTDTNDDGQINQDDTPTVLISTSGDNPSLGAYLRAVRGDNGEEIWAYTDRKVNSFSSPAAGDLDNDGDPEVVAYTWRDERFGAPTDAALVALDHEGRELWTNGDVASGVGFERGSPAIANIDTGRAGNEIATCFWLVSSTGETIWDARDSLPDGVADRTRGFCSPVAVDLDDDGALEIVIGAAAFEADGSVMWFNETLWEAWGRTLDNSPAVADLNGDGTPEVIVAMQSLYVLDGATGNVISSQPLPGGGFGGAPVIADLDGDGTPEIGIASTASFSVFSAADNNLSLVWTVTTRDYSGGVTGATAFDFDGNGLAEIVYNDEHFLRVYDGRTGEEIFKEANWSGTGVEYPVVADVDGDGNAELLVSRNTIGGHHEEYDGGFPGGTLSGLRALGDPNDNWIAARLVWNQYSYHTTNVADDGTIPTSESAHFSAPNTNGFRSGFRGGVDAFFAPDLYIRAMGLIAQGAEAGNHPQTGTPLCPAYNRLDVEVCNDGDAPVLAGLPVALVLNDNTEAGRGLTQGRLDPDGCEQVRIEFNSVVGGNFLLSVVVDPDSQYSECAEQNNARVYGFVDLSPTSGELCDNIDNNCDGAVDEDLTRVCETQCGDGVRVCDAGEFGECSAPSPTDEVCDGRDNDCNGVTDDIEAACGDGALMCMCQGVDDCGCVFGQTVENECGLGCPLGSACGAEGVCEPICEDDYGCPQGQICGPDSTCEEGP